MYKTKFFYLSSTIDGYPKLSEKDELDKLMNEGWYVKSVTPQVVSSGYGTLTQYGGYLFVLTK